MAHGRPHLKDFCWQDGRATLIDFERFDAARHTPQRQRNDLMMLVFSVQAEPAAGPEALAAVVAGYRSVAPDGTWRAAVGLARRMRWIAAPIGWAGRLRPRRDGARDEFAALAPTLAFFARG